MGLFSPLLPDRREDSVYQMDFGRLYEQGYRGLLFDIDNTLVGHGAPADPRAIALFDTLHSIGFETCLISNNDEPRVRPFAEAVNSRYICKAGKPSGRGYQKACEEMGLSAAQVCFIGDQIFTDTWGANRAGIHSILVKRLYFHEEIQIHLKRILEWIVLLFYRENEQ